MAVTSEDSSTTHSKLAICRDPRRDASLLCVVEESSDVTAIERAGRFRGRYHVLGGRISPLEGVGPESLHVDRLMERVARSEEHTSELQSHSDLVCRLLLEKKK